MERIAEAARLLAPASSAGERIAAFARLNEDRLIRDLSRATASYDGPARQLDRFLLAEALAAPSDEARKAAIAGLAASLSRRIASAALPNSILALYPRSLKLLNEYLTDSPIYDADCFAKDARFVAGLAAPAGAQTVDIVQTRSMAAELRELSRFAGMLARLLLGNEIAAGAKLIGAEGWRSWLEIHTDQRDLEDFNEVGWEACYIRVAEILELRPELAGIWGASWFYDPQLPAISPHLAYLQARPLERGAIMVRLGPGRVHTERAMKKSATRRALILSGCYQPICYAMFWPRRDLLGWANGNGLGACASN